MTLSDQAKTALQAAICGRGPGKGMFLARAPNSRTLAYAAWHGAMLSCNPYKASIAGMMFMTAEQRVIREEITNYMDMLPKHVLIGLDRDRKALETLGVW